MQLGLPVYFLFGLQLILLPFQVISFISRKSDSKRKKFLILSVLYAILNFAWVSSYIESLSTFFSIEVMYAISIATISYTYYYWSSEFKLKSSETRIHQLLLHSFLLFLTVSLVKFFDGNLTGWKLIAVLTYAELIVLIFSGRIIIHSRSLDEKKMDVRLNAILMSCVSAFFIPFSLIFLSNTTLQYLSINIGFLIVTFAYLFVYVNQMRSEWLTLENIESKLKNEELEIQKISETLDKFSALTARELEVAKLMVQHLMWKEIADILNISVRTATKHGSNIYSKFGVSNREEFLEQVNSLGGL